MAQPFETCDATNIDIKLKLNTPFLPWSKKLQNRRALVLFRQALSSIGCGFEPRHASVSFSKFMREMTFKMCHEI